MHGGGCEGRVAGRVRVEWKGFGVHEDPGREVELYQYLSEVVDDAEYDEYCMYVFVIDTKESMEGIKGSYSQFLYVDPPEDGPQTSDAAEIAKQTTRELIKTLVYNCSDCHKRSSGTPYTMY